MSERSTGYRWRLRELMATKGLWKTSDLGPLLAARGIELSSSQIYRLVAKTPERLSLDILAALCDILSCTPNDLIELTGAVPVRDLRDTRAFLAKARPRRARVDPT